MTNAMPNDAVVVCCDCDIQCLPTLPYQIKLHCLHWINHDVEIPPYQPDPTAQTNSASSLQLNLISTVSSLGSDQVGPEEVGRRHKSCPISLAIDGRSRAEDSH